MAKEYIEREAAKARLRLWITDCVLDGDNETADRFRDCIDLLDSIPAADVAPVRRGQWDGEGDGYADGEIVIDVWYCSECGYCIDDGTDDPNILPNYCPDCGSKMDKEVADETERTN